MRTRERGSGSSARIQEVGGEHRNGKGIDGDGMDTQVCACLRKRTRALLPITPWGFQFS